MVGNREVGVTEEVAYATPFGSLLHFKKDGAPEQPRMLLVAPMSGHFATLLRGTVKTLLQDHDVYITDWHNPRDIPLSEGRFGLDDYTDHLIDFLDRWARARTWWRSASPRSRRSPRPPSCARTTIPSRPRR